MDGIINLNKPTGITSAKAVYRVRSLTGQHKSGHAGTLDPGASGVLVICLGKATKLVEGIMDQPKVYRATARLDVTSESFDSDRPVVAVDVAEIPSREVVLAAFAAFEGTIEQVPPAISAIKVAGKPAYKRVRQDQFLTLKARRIRIDWISVQEYDWPTIVFEMSCGRGTYVRSLIRDLGKRLRTGGCLTSLVRRRIGPFREEDAWSFDALCSATDPGDYLIDLDRARELLQQSR